MTLYDLYEYGPVWPCMSLYESVLFRATLYNSALLFWLNMTLYNFVYHWGENSKNDEKFNKLNFKKIQRFKKFK